MNENRNIELNKEIKELIIETLNISDVNADDVVDSDALFGPDNVFGLDSIDAIEIIMAVQRKYEVRIDDQNTAKDVLNSIDSIAEFVINAKSE